MSILNTNQNYALFAKNHFPFKASLIKKNDSNKIYNVMPGTIIDQYNNEEFVVLSVPTLFNVKEGEELFLKIEKTIEEEELSGKDDALVKISEDETVLVEGLWKLTKQKITIKSINITSINEENIDLDNKKTTYIKLSNLRESLPLENIESTLDSSHLIFDYNQYYISDDGSKIFTLRDG